MPNSRLLGGELFRRLQAVKFSVVESYNITIPPTTSVSVDSVQQALIAPTMLANMTRNIATNLAGTAFQSLTLNVTSIPKPNLVVIGSTATTSVAAAKASGAYYAKGCLATLSLLIAAALS